MNRTRRTLLFFSVACITFGMFGFLSWKRGTPYGTPYYSPNRQYYVQKYHNTSLNSFLPAMPGGGSDMIDGYVRLYDRDGKLLHERFQTFLNGADVIWAGEKVYLGGSEYGDSHPLQLPSSSE